MVSVIIPIYNVAGYLDACVKSVSNQTYRDLEIILVDDGSTDCSSTLCDKWAMKDQRVRVVHKNNGGLSDARNAGLNIAKGKYIYFVDGDDTIESDAVEILVNAMEKGADMVAYNYFRDYDDKSVEICTYFKTGSYSLNSEKEHLNFICGVLLQYKIGWEAWGRIFRRDLIERYNLRFADNRIIFAEDIYFSLCYLAHADRIDVIADYLYHYTVRSESIMGVETKNINIGRMNELSKAVMSHYSQWSDCKYLKKNYTPVHYFIIWNVLARALKNTNLPIKEFRSSVIEDIGDWSFFTKGFRNVLKYSKYICGESGNFFQEEERLLLTNYIISGNYVRYALECRYLYGTKYKREEIRIQDKKKTDIQRKYILFAEYEKRVWLIGTEDFGNVGDHQIAESILAFVGNILPDHKIIEVTASHYKDERENLLQSILPDDLIVLTGGGNFGNVYPLAQKIREDIIQQKPKNMKIIFPQTIYYSDTEEGMRKIEEARKIFTSSNNVIICAREQVSFEIAQRLFPCKVLLIPDIVLSCKKIEEINRENIILCLRGDLEKKLSQNDIALLENSIQELSIDYIRSDLQLKKNVDAQYRKDVIRAKLKQWQHSKLVVTDRLHGMIFAAITGTPCIVFSNYNQKVKGTYEWIKYLPYIRYVENIEQAIKYIPELLKMKNCKFDNGPLWEHFNKLTEVIKKYVD
ncbi:MAG: glycosyltransferase [Ruminococcus sp.]